MPIPCSQTCGDYDFSQWQMLDESAWQFLEYCALEAAAANYPGPGPFQPIGVYINNIDADYIVPADASLIYWDVSDQSADRNLDYTLVPEGSMVGVFAANTNGFQVIGATTINDITPRYSNARSIDGAGNMLEIYGSAAQYDVGTSGATVPLLNTNWVKTGTTEFQGNVEIDGSNRLYFGSSSNPYFTNNGNIGFSYIWPTGTDAFSVYKLALIGANDLVFDSTPVAGSYVVFQAQGAATAGLIFNTTADNLIQFRPNSTQAVEITDNGTLIATGGTGGTRVAKLLTGVATMALGTTGAIADTFIAAGSPLLVTPNFAPLGTLYATRNPGVGFTILSTNAADAGSVSYQRSVL
jgi:hypothetical protein